MASIGTVKVKFDDEQQEKLVNLCMKYKAENEKLREEIEQWERLTKGVELPDYPITEFQPKDVERENAKLRELVKDMYHDLSHETFPPDWIVEYENDLRELGIEVD